MKTLSKVLTLGLIIGFFTNCQKSELIDIDKQSQEIEIASQFKSSTEADYYVFLQNLIVQIEELGLNKGNTNALVVKINAAIKSFDKGNFKAAKNQLSAFIRQVITFEKVGKITSDQSQMLIDLAQKAIEGDFQTWTPGDDWVDVRDNQVYKTIVIGDQCWFAENLAYVPENMEYPAEIFLNYDYPNGVIANKPNVLYNGYAIITPYENQTNTVDICPDGWHLPTDAEWFELVAYLESISIEEVGSQLKATEGWDWINGTNSSGFNAVRTGIYLWGYNEYHTYFWSSEYDDQGYPYFWIRGLNGWENILQRYGATADGTGYSVRCIKD